MPLTERERQTQERYNVSAREWVEHSGGENRPCFWPEIQHFMINLEGNEKVLEVGCGPATDGKYLAQCGAKVFSIDYSTTMVEIAKKVDPSALLAPMDMQSLGFGDNQFDGFWATACILHLEKPDKALRELVRVTKNGGVGLITIKEGDGEAVDPRTGYYFRYYQNPDFIRKLQSIGLKTIQSGRKAGSPGHDWLTYLVKVTK
jgi:ubiquinone/menaquinone biosynthesis C-methylase UbiE